MPFSPITLFCLCFFVGACGGVWSVLSREDDPELIKQYMVGLMGGALAGLSAALVLYGYEAMGLTEGGQCKILGAALILGMSGKEATRRLLAAVGKFLGGDQSGRDSQSYQDHQNQQSYPQKHATNAPPRKKTVISKNPPSDQSGPPDSGNKMSWP